MKKIYFHITFLVLFVLFTLFTYISSCHGHLPGECGSMLKILISLSSLALFLLSLLFYLGYLLLNFLKRDSRFFKLALYVLMCLYIALAATHWWFSIGVYRFVVPQENLKKQQEWQKQHAPALDNTPPFEVNSH